MTHMKLNTSKSMSTLSKKSATVAEFRRCLAVFGDSHTFLRQCGQGLTQVETVSQTDYHGRCVNFFTIQS